MTASKDRKIRELQQALSAKVTPLTAQEIFDLIGAAQYPYTDQQDGDMVTYLDEHYNFSALARAINKRIANTE